MNPSCVTEMVYRPGARFRKVKAPSALVNTERLPGLSSTRASGSCCCPAAAPARTTAPSIDARERPASGRGAGRTCNPASHSASQKTGNMFNRQSWPGGPFDCKLWACVFPSLQRRGGRAIKKMSPLRIGADGVVSSAKSLGLKSFAELTTPSARSKVASRYFLDRASTPPFQGGEYCEEGIRRRNFQTQH